MNVIQIMASKDYARGPKLVLMHSWKNCWLVQWIHWYLLLKSIIWDTYYEKPFPENEKKNRNE